MTMQVDFVVGSAVAPTTTYVEYVKPVLDRALSFVLLVVLAPLMALIWVAVRCTLGREAIFRQQRVGLHGENFTILKFRTMKHDRRRRHEPIAFDDRRLTHKTTADPRHTRLGRFLRATSLDELPQLVNVLRGEMSLVGPRPELSEVADRYDLRHHPRHQVRPGITGLWQISPERNCLLHENLRPDLEYLSCVGPRTDLGVLVRTVEDVFSRRGG
ncbi:MAG: sugar transferase [Actinomycetota bacterium]